MRLTTALALATSIAALGGSTALAQESGAPAERTLQIDDSPWPDLQQVKAYFRAAYEKRCDWLFTNEDFDAYTPDVWELGYRYSYEEADQPEHPVTVYKFGCTAGAYNFGDVYLLVKEWDGIQPASFAQPEIRFDADGVYDAGAGVVGYTSGDILINSDFDPQSRRVTDYSKWRGLGDASSSGIWELVEDRFVLRYYEIDPTFDEEINPFPLVDWRAAN